MSRQDQYDVTVVVSYGGTTRDMGTFDGFSGGEITADDTKFYPGGMQNQISLGGRRSVENFTLTRLYNLTRDHPLQGWLAAGVGRATVVATKASLTVDRGAVPDPLIYQGTLIRHAPPEHDSNSSDAATYELEVSSATVTQ